MNDKELTVEFKNKSQKLKIESETITTFNNIPYVVIVLQNRHILYVKKTFIIPNPLDITNHAIESDNEVNGKNYYIKINLDFALPL